MKRRNWDKAMSIQKKNFTLTEWLQCSAHGKSWLSCQDFRLTHVWSRLLGYTLGAGTIYPTNAIGSTPIPFTA